MGYLHATPEGGKECRLEMLRRAGQKPSLPDIEAGEYFVAMLAGENGLGWCAVDGMGATLPLPWSEIDAYSRAAGLDLDPWEARQIRAMSAAYVDGLRVGRDKSAAAPYEAEGDERARKLALAQAIMSQLRHGRGRG